MAKAAVSDIRGIGLGQRQMTFDANKTERSEMVTIEIDLTDPQDLMHKMEMIDLTEEETDLLIDRAMELNKQLRQLEKQDRLEKEFRSFTISAPASKQNARAGHRGICTPSSPRSNYRHNATLQDNSLARLQSGNMSITGTSQGHRSTRVTDPFKFNPYSYHSARPTGKQSSTKDGTSGRYTSSMDDY